MKHLLGLLAGLLVPTVPAVAYPALWEVSDGDSAIHLFGSFHVLPADSTWRSAVFDRLLTQADRVVFETDIRPEAQAVVGAQALVRGIYVDGTLLTDKLDPGQEDQLRIVAKDNAIPVGTLLAMRPWFAANTLGMTAMIAAGYSEEGVEAQLQPEVEDKRLGFLETGAQQLDVLAGAPEDEQLAMLQSTLDDMPKLAKTMEKMMDGWLAGTPENMERLFLTEMGGFEDFYLERLLYQRNRNWVPQLEAMLADNVDALVVVGAAHLIGDSSVIDLLEEAGYSARRLQ